MLLSRFFLLCACLTLISYAALAQSNYTSTDFFVPNGDLQLQVRKITETTYSSRKKIPLLLIHGGTGALTSFDLNVPDASFAKALSDAGFTVYLMNIRGWERSTAPAYPLNDTSVVGGSRDEAVSDIDAVITFLLKDFPDGRINLFGWAAGGHWASYYTTLHPEKISHLVVLNSLYGVKAPWQLNSSFADPANPAIFNNSILIMRQSNELAILDAWKTEPPTDTAGADSSVIKAFVRSAVSFNNEHLLKVPGGFGKESFYMAQGKKYWDAGSITVPTLIIRGDQDFWSRPEDLEAFYNDLQNTPVKKKITLTNAGHFVILDRNTNARRSLIIAINNFIKKGL